MRESLASPTGLNPSAQGWRSYLGYSLGESVLPQGACVISYERVGHNSVEVNDHVVMIPQVARGRTTWGWRMEARWARGDWTLLGWQTSQPMTNAESTNKNPHPR